MIRQLRKIFAILAVISILTLFATLNVGAIATTEVGITQYTNRFYVIQNVYSGKFLEVANGNLVQGTNVWQDTFNFDVNLSQVFAVFAADPADLQNNNSNIDYYRLSPALNQDLCVDVYSAEDVDGTNIHVFAENPYYGAQSFEFEQNSDGSYYIRPYLSSTRVLSVANNSNANHANVELNTKESGNKSQKWVFKEIHPTKDPDLIKLKWSYFFQGDYSLPNRIISQRMHLDGSDSGNWHIGTDFIADEGVPVYSPFAGKIVALDEGHNSMGNYVIIQSNAKIQTPQGLKPLTVRLLHFSALGNVQNNQSITTSTLLGYVGNTGQSNGNHLHVDVNTGGEFWGDLMKTRYKNNELSILNVEKFFLSKRFRYGGRSSNIYATDVVY